MKVYIAIACCAVFFTQDGEAATPQESAQYIEQFISKTADLGPGYGLTIVEGDTVLINKTWGVRNADLGQKLTTDTPMYIASQTKAYIGLVAAYLDQKGILKLNEPITKFWPASSFPEGVNGSKWTLHHLLTHQVPIKSNFITETEAYYTEIDYTDYPELLTMTGSKRDPGFDYDNLGYNVYAAILRQATGKSWRTWLDDVIFSPYGMKQTSTKTSDFQIDSLSWSHKWLGQNKRWATIPPKTDSMMQSAGGIVTSTSDMSKWLQLNLSFGDKHVTSQMLKLAQKSIVDTDPTSRNAYEMPCSGYSLGWNICLFEDKTIYIHGGSYTGTRSLMALIPELNIGFAAFSNSDNMTGTQTLRIFKQFMLHLTDDPKTKQWEEHWLKLYPDDVAKLLAKREKRLKESESDESWQGWRYAPEQSELVRYTGRFLGRNKYLVVELALENNKLKGEIFDAQFDLRPATPELFGKYSLPFISPEPFKFVLSDEGEVVSLIWNGETFIKQ